MTRPTWSRSAPTSPRRCAPTALAAALARVLDDDAHRAHLVTAGRERAAAYSWDTTTARLVDLYRLAAG